jgi:hypothetical protein
MPASLAQVATEMRRDYATGEQWWITEPVPRAPSRPVASPVSVVSEPLAGATPPTVDDRVPE